MSQICGMQKIPKCNVDIRI